MSNNLDELIKSSLKTEDVPGLELNNLLKVQIQDTEAKLLKKGRQRQISLWYVPMILNFLMFSLTAVMAQIFIPYPQIGKVITYLSVYLIFIGVFLTVMGVWRADLRNKFSIRRKQRGIWYEN